MRIRQNDVLFWISLILAIWFALFGMVWVYWAALFVAYPAGIGSYLIHNFIKEDNKKRNKIILFVLGIGSLVSVAVLIGLLITN